MACRSWHWLIERVVPWRDQLRAVQELFGRVVPEPVFVRLVTLDDRVPCVGRMVTCVLGWGRVTAADVSTLRATTQVEPPTTGGEALDASRTAGRRCWVYFLEVIDVSIIGVEC
jgi:hypothetical protein